jgi:hypothetical protein
MRRVAVLLLLLAPPAARAGLHFSEEAFAELPSQWRGFLLDLRRLRGVAATGPDRPRYEQAAARLSAKAELSADEAADLGALDVRLGQVERALAVLQPAQRRHPYHYRLAANLGTAWQLAGEPDRAAALLELAVRLAPGRLQRAEELHLALVRHRAREPKGTTGPDDLFGVRFVGPSGKYEPGRLAPEEARKLPADAVANVQLLALWLPRDARLVWLLAELAAAGGDLSGAAALADACVTEYGLTDPDLREHRRLLRAAADAQEKAGPVGRTGHDGHAFRPRSSRPLPGRADRGDLPPIDARGVNALPWAVLAETTLGPDRRPAFAAYLRELDGKQVTLIGHMQPLGPEARGAFMLVEHPVGCWWCEAPTTTEIVRVEPAGGAPRAFTRAPLRVTGRLVLNADGPPGLLYALREARVEGP